MGAGAFELIVERPVPVQNAVEDVGGDPPCGEAGYFRGGRESLGGHGSKMFLRVGVTVCFGTCHCSGVKLWHANMPNVRIKDRISRL